MGSPWRSDEALLFVAGEDGDWSPITGVTEFEVDFEAEAEGYRDRNNIMEGSREITFEATFGEQTADDEAGVDIPDNPEPDEEMQQPSEREKRLWAFHRDVGRLLEAERAVTIESPSTVIDLDSLTVEYRTNADELFTHPSVALTFTTSDMDFIEDVSSGADGMVDLVIDGEMHMWTPTSILQYDMSAEIDDTVEYSVELDWTDIEPCGWS